MYITLELQNVNTGRKVLVCWSHNAGMGDDQTFHARTRVKRVLLAEAGIDHVDNAVNREAGLRDIRR